jgi:hypothetical protein
VRGGVDCNLVNPIFWFSGDPVSNVGWISTAHRDVRGESTTGPFVLVKDQEIEILVSYEIDRGTTPLGGITAVRAVSDAIQTFYENNFGYPIVSVEDELPAVSEFKLEQNYPNPFNPSTIIKFGIPERSNVQITIYDLLGSEVTTLLNQELDKGWYDLTFNANGFSSGFYIYRMQAGNYISTKKMLMIK